MRQSSVVATPCTPPWQKDFPLHSQGLALLPRAIFCCNRDRKLEQGQPLPLRRPRVRPRAGRCRLRQLMHADKSPPLPGFGHTCCPLCVQHPQMRSRGGGTRRQRSLRTSLDENAVQAPRWQKWCAGPCIRHASSPHHRNHLRPVGCVLGVHPHMASRVLLHRRQLSEPL